MARLSNSILKGLKGSMGGVVFYEVDGVTLTRSKPGKRTNAQKKRRKYSPRNQRSMGKFAMVQAYIKDFKEAIAFGFQNEASGPSRPYHACASYTLLHCFSSEGQNYFIDPALIKVSLGPLCPPEDASAQATEEGILFSWKDNSGVSSAKPDDLAFVVLHNAESKVVRFEKLGSRRNSEQFLFERRIIGTGNQWHAYLAFSQLTRDKKKRILSDSVYLGLIQS